MVMIVAEITISPIAIRISATPRMKRLAIMLVIVITRVPPFELSASYRNY